MPTASAPVVLYGNATPVAQSIANHNILPATAGIKILWLKNQTVSNKPAPVHFGQNLGHSPKKTQSNVF